MIPTLPSEELAHRAVQTARGSAARWLAGWWRLLNLAAMVLVLVMSPVTYRRGSRGALLRSMYTAVGPSLMWFTLLASLISLIIIRIVVTTAQSYGLTQYALEAVVRVLVLELLPLAAPVFVALRYSIPGADELYARRIQGNNNAASIVPLEAAAGEFMPRVVAGVFACALLVAISCVVSLVLAYFSVYGFVTSGLAEYTRRVGQVFTPGVTLIFTLKTLFFSLGVSLIPLTSALYDADRHMSRSSVELHGLVRVFSIVLLIEVASLIGNYY